MFFRRYELELMFSKRGTPCVKMKVLTLVLLLAPSAAFVPSLKVAPSYKTIVPETSGTKQLIFCTPLSTVALGWKEGAQF